MEQPAVCGERNGSYTCQFEFAPGARHAGMHYAYYIRAGRVYIAEWVDKWGRVTARKAPAPLPARR